MELLDICNEEGFPTGETVERSRAHSEGILHRTAHVWVIREVDGRTQVLLQKRSMDKDSYPGMYDTSSAGHIPAGAEPFSSFYCVFRSASLLYNLYNSLFHRNICHLHILPQSANNTDMLSNSSKPKRGGYHESNRYCTQNRRSRTGRHSKGNPQNDALERWRPLTEIIDTGFGVLYGN